MSASRKVYLNDIDISRYIIDIPTVVQTTGEYGQLVVNDIQSMTGNNLNGFWDVNNPASPFYGLNTFDNYMIIIELDDVPVFSGIIKTINADNNTRAAEVVLKSALQIALEHGCIYASTAAESPSQAILNICDLYKIQTDGGSFGFSNSIYDLNNIRIEIRAIDPFVSVVELIQQIADIGVAKIYSLNNILYYEVYQPKTSAPLTTFSDNPNGVISIYSHPISGWIEKDAVNGYSIETVAGNATLGLESQQGKTLSCGVDAPIRILDLNTAVWVGDLWVSYLNTAQKRIEFGVPADYGRLLPLGSTIILDYTLRGWEEITLDVIEIENTSRVISKIVGVTR